MSCLRTFYVGYSTIYTLKLLLAACPLVQALYLRHVVLQVLNTLWPGRVGRQKARAARAAT